MFKIITFALGLALLVPGPASADIKAFCDVQREKLAPYFKTLADAQRYKIHEQRRSKAYKKCLAIDNDIAKHQACLGGLPTFSEIVRAFPDPDVVAVLEAEDELKHWKNSLLYTAYCKKF